MDIKELENIMILNGVVLRALPRIMRGIYETRHIDIFPNGTIEYLEEYKREMLVVYTVPKNAGKFIFECARNTMNSVSFAGKKYYDTIEEAVNDLLENIKE